MKNNNHFSQWCFILMLILVPVGFGFYSLLLGQDTNWDLLNYHLYNPYAFLNGRLNLDLLPGCDETFYNPYLDVIYFQSIKYAAPWIVGFVLALIQGFNFIVLFFICKQCLKAINEKFVKWAMVLALLGVLSVGFLSEVGTVQWDNLVSLFPLTSLLIVIATINSIVSGKRYAFLFIVLAGIIAGMGGGLKLVVIPYAVSLFLSFFIISIPWERRLILALFFGGGLVAGVILTDGYWLWTVWHLMGNPLFPRMNQIFHGELAPFTADLDVRYLPRNLLERMFYPVVFTVDSLRVGEKHVITQISWLIVYSFSVFFFLVNGIRFFYKMKINPLRQEVKYLLSFFWVSFLIWMNVFGVYRYQITIEVLIPLIIFVLFLSISKSNLLTPLMVVAMLVFVTLFNVNGVPDWGHSPWASKVYSVETKGIQKEKIGSVVLIDSALSWVIPAFDIKVPFVQIKPHIPVNEAYFQRAKFLINSSHNGKILIIFQPWIVSPREASVLLSKYDLGIKNNSCLSEKGCLGTKKISFWACSAERI